MFKKILSFLIIIGVYRFTWNGSKFWIHLKWIKVSCQQDSAMTTIQIKYCDIPVYLHAGNFYRNLDHDDRDGLIDVPVDSFQRTQTAANLEEFRQLLRVMVFWALDKIPFGVLDFCSKNSVEAWSKGLVGLPGAVEVEIKPQLLMAYSSLEDESLSNVIATGRWELIKHVVHKMDRKGNATAIAASLGDLPLMKFLREKGFVWHEDTCAVASKNGHLTCLEYAHENRCPWDGAVYFYAAANGHVSCIGYACEQGLEWHADVCREAALNGQLECLRFAHENGCPWNNMTTQAAAQEGHIDCLRFAHEKGCPWKNDVYYIAVKKGHLVCMQYVFEQGLEWNTDVCRYAALGGQLLCLQFAHLNGCPWDIMTTAGAAQYGHASCLEYALEHSCPVDKGPCNLACKHGHLECLQLLHQFGAPWDEYAPFHAAVCPDVACLQYLHENGCPWDEDTSHTAAIRGNIAPLKYAMENGCPYRDNIVSTTVRSSKLECIRYLVEEQGLYMDLEVFKVALLRGNLHCLEYLIDQGCPILDAKFTYTSAKIWDVIFVKDNPEFVQCVEYAMERGWRPDRTFIDFVVVRDEACRKWLLKEGHIGKVPTKRTKGENKRVSRVNAVSCASQTDAVVISTGVADAIHSSQQTDVQDCVKDCSFIYNCRSTSSVDFGQQTDSANVSSLSICSAAAAAPSRLVDCGYDIDLKTKTGKVTRDLTRVVSNISLFAVFQSCATVHFCWCIIMYVLARYQS